MIKSGINPIHFAEIFSKMKEKEKNIIDKKILKYISTHPDIDSRIEKAKNMSKLFRGKEDKFKINWLKVKRSLPSVFDY